MNLTGHLEELRKRIIISLVFLAVTSAISFPLASKILSILKYPAHHVIDKLAFFSPQEALIVYVNIAIFTGLILSSPVILYELFSFISPAIEPRIKKYSLLFVFSSLIAFILGCLFAYLILLPNMFQFLLSFADENLVPMISVNKYVSFMLILIVGCGVVFEMPVLSFILAKIGIINSYFLRKKFKYAVLIIFVLAAIITPTPDVFNMTISAVPMVLIYEVSIWVSKLASLRKE